jgi:hypothetical protein
MPKPLLIALLAIATAGIAAVIYIQYQSITKSPEVQKTEEGTRKIDKALCEIDKKQNQPNSESCKRAAEP